MKEEPVYFIPEVQEVQEIEEVCETMEIEDHEVEAELTSLSWLQSLDITTASSLPTPPCSPSPPPIPSRTQAKKLSPLMKAEIGTNFQIYLRISKNINFVWVQFDRSRRKCGQVSYRCKRKATILICHTHLPCDAK